MRELAGGVLAGLCITLGGCALLASENAVIGALLFSVALLTICSFGFSLYTGRVGDLAERHRAEHIAALLLGLLGNALGCAVFGLLAGAGLPALALRAQTIVEAKLSVALHEVLIRAFFCGVLMTIAVRIYREKGSVVGIFLCVPAFILSGFEHSIANMFYIAAARTFSPYVLLYLVVVLLGNSIGGVLIPLCMRLFMERKKNGEG